MASVEALGDDTSMKGTTNKVLGHRLFMLTRIIAPASQNEVVLRMMIHLFPISEHLNTTSHSVICGFMSYLRCRSPGHVDHEAFYLELSYSPFFSRVLQLPIFLLPTNPPFHLREYFLAWRKSSSFLSVFEKYLSVDRNSFSFKSF